MNFSIFSWRLVEAGNSGNLNLFLQSFCIERADLSPAGLPSTNKFFKNGKVDGEEFFYHKNGQLKDICTWIEHKINGEYKQYDENGQLIEFCNYNNGIKVE